MLARAVKAKFLRQRNAQPRLDLSTATVSPALSALESLTQSPAVRDLMERSTAKLAMQVQNITPATLYHPSAHRIFWLKVAVAEQGEGPGTARQKPEQVLQQRG